MFRAVVHKDLNDGLIDENGVLKDDALRAEIARTPPPKRSIFSSMLRGVLVGMVIVSGTYVTMHVIAQRAGQADPSVSPDGKVPILALARMNTPEKRNGADDFSDADGAAQVYNFDEGSEEPAVIVAAAPPATRTDVPAAPVVKRTPPMLAPAEDKADIPAEPEPVETASIAPTKPVAAAKPPVEPAMDRNASAFVPPEGAALMAVVLREKGRHRISSEVLRLMTMPLTIALSPSGPENRVLAEMAHAAGHEILAELPAGTEVVMPDVRTLSAVMPPAEMSALTAEYMDGFELAVGATLSDGAGLVTNPTALSALLTPLAERGYLWIDPEASGFSMTRQVAGIHKLTWAESDRGVPIGATQDDIYRVIEEAAVEARETGSVIVTIPASQDALKALLRWGLERGSADLKFAPLTAVIRKRTGG